MKKILFKLKGFLVAPFLIYVYNLIASPFGYIVPINILTIAIVGFLDIPGLVMLVLFYIISF